MKNYKLYLALSDLTEQKEIEQFEFYDIDDLTHKILNHKGMPEDRVYLCAIHDIDEDESLEILVTESYPLMRDFIESFDLNVNIFPLSIHVQMYESYEDAYAVALDMREGSPLCYIDNKAALEFNEETQSFRIGESEKELDTEGFKTLAILKNIKEAENIVDYLKVTTKLMGVKNISYDDLQEKVDDLIQFMSANNKNL
ncbi:MAG: hypothetical protein ACOYMB_04980 [Patescibacteria group bacterium]